MIQQKSKPWNWDISQWKKYIFPLKSITYDIVSAMQAIKYAMHSSYQSALFFAELSLNQSHRKV